MSGSGDTQRYRVATAYGSSREHREFPGDLLFEGAGNPSSQQREREIRETGRGGGGTKFGPGGPEKTPPLLL